MRTVQTMGQNGAASGRSGRFSGRASVPGHRIRYLPWNNILPPGGADRKDITMLKTPDNVFSSTPNIPPAQVSS